MWPPSRANGRDARKAREQGEAERAPHRHSGADVGARIVVERLRGGGGEADGEDAGKQGGGAHRRACFLKRLPTELADVTVRCLCLSSLCQEEHMCIQTWSPSRARAPGGHQQPPVPSSLCTSPLAQGADQCNSLCQRKPEGQVWAVKLRAQHSRG